MNLTVYDSWMLKTQIDSIRSVDKTLEKQEVIGRAKSELLRSNLHKMTKNAAEQDYTNSKLCYYRESLLIDIPSVSLPKPNLNQFELKTMTDGGDFLYRNTIKPRKNPITFDLLKKRIILQQGHNQKSVDLIQEYLNSASGIDRAFDSIKKLACADDNKDIADDLIKAYRHSTDKQFVFMKLMLKLNDLQHKSNIERQKVSSSMRTTSAMVDRLESRERLTLSNHEQRCQMIAE